MLKKYFFKNLSSSDTDIVPVDDNVNGTIASFTLGIRDLELLSDYRKPNPYEFGFVVSGDIQDCTVLLELYDGTEWIIIQEYVKVDLLKTVDSNLVPIINFLLGGIMFNVQHRLRIYNPNAISLTNINAYFLLH